MVVAVLFSPPLVVVGKGRSAGRGVGLADHA